MLAGYGGGTWSPLWGSSWALRGPHTNAIATWVRRYHVTLLPSLTSPAAACLHHTTTATPARWGLFPAWIQLFLCSCQSVLSRGALQPLGFSRTCQLLLGFLRSPALYHLCSVPAQGPLMRSGCASPALSWLQPQDAKQLSLPHHASPKAGMGVPEYPR